MYSHELMEVLTLEPPSVKPKDDGFLDISGVQYKETTISKVYAYFLNSEKIPQVAELFLNGLMEMVKEKTQRSFTLSNPVCSLEVMTDKGNRIDLLIESNESSNGKASEKDKEAIIIENKIYSGIYNDLEDYWNSVKAGNKIGVLLTVNPSEVGKESKFINITHSEWMQKIKASGLPAGLTMNQYVYLNDFISNMENLKESSALNPEARFFFEHSERVLKAKQTFYSAYEYVIAQLRIVAEKLGYTLYGNSWGWRHIWDSKNAAQVYYAVVPDTVVTAKPEITIFLEVYKDALKRTDEFKQLLKEKGFYNTLHDDNKVTAFWAHLAYKTYQLDKADLENLSEFVLKKIENDFQPAYDVIYSMLKSA